MHEDARALPRVVKKVRIEDDDAPPQKRPCMNFHAALAARKQTPAPRPQLGGETQLDGPAIEPREVKNRFQQPPGYFLAGAAADGGGAGAL